MRLGISSPLSHDTPEQWAKQQKDLGCRTVVFPVQSNEPEEKILAYKAAADREGLTIAEVGIWRNALSQDPEERKRNMDYCVAQLRLADLVGARCCVNVAGAFGPVWDGPYRENYSPGARRETIRMIQEIIDRADVKRTWFTLEPMPWMIPTGPEDYAQLLDEVGRDRFAVHLDIINMTSSMERYFHPEELVDACAELLGSRIKSCHIKDIHMNGAYTTQLEECAPGCGEFPIRYYVEKMDALDKDMPMILEHLQTDEEYLKVTAYLREVLHGLYQNG